ncbi:energy transducer TonB [Flavobacteriaceae bacterium]|nr:energy transducer TonB [Flavobacteriaceae bacterium]MDB4240141.1 energy transducer TonB [Flavobacteriaceae bacterium]MDB9901782.1 energy transducer TonB [Flavobacteriaceae bacterium]
MFKKLLSVVFLFFFSFLFSQDNEVVTDEFPVFPICKLVPVKNQSICFNETLSEHIEKYFIFPDSAKDIGLQSVVNVFFEIDINGKVDKLFAKSSIVGVEFKDAESLRIANAVFEEAAMKIFDQLPIMKPGKINGIVSPRPFRIPVTYRLESQNFDPNDIFTLDSIDWAPLFPKAVDVTPETSISLFKENIDFYVNKYLKYPKTHSKDSDQVIVFLELIIENDGNIFEITSFGDEEYRVLAEKVIKKIPSLEPALKNDYPVAISYSFPVVFNKK